MFVTTVGTDNFDNLHDCVVDVQLCIIEGVFGELPEAKCNDDIAGLDEGFAQILECFLGSVDEEAAMNEHGCLYRFLRKNLRAIY